MKKALAGLALLASVSPALAQSKFTLPPPAGTILNGVQVVATCGQASGLVAGNLAYMAMDTTGTLCSYGSGGGGGGGNVNLTGLNGTAPSTTNPLYVAPAAGQTFPISGSISATNPSVSATGAAVPSQATYFGMIVGGNLTGVPGTANGVKVDGSAVTQPISASALPLPTGAATQTTLASILSALGSPFQAGGSIGNTAFGISGTLPAYAATPTFNCGTGCYQATQPVSATSLPLPTGAATAANQNSTAAGTTATNAQAVQGVTGGVAVPISGAVTANQATATTTMATAAPTAGTFSSILATSATRKACLIQNVGTTLGYIYPQASGGTTSNSFQIAAGGSFSCTNNNVTLTDAITGTCASGTCAFVISSQ